MSRICVLGGSGFIGKAVVSCLRSHGHIARVVSRSRRAHDAAPDVEWLTGHYDDVAALRNLVAGCDAVVNLAGSATPVRATQDPEAELGELAVAIRVADAVRANGCARLIHVSSGGTVYGETQCAAISEDHPTVPIGVHGALKLAVEGLIRARLTGGVTQLVILRVANAFGPHQDPFRGQGLVGVLLRASLDGQPVAIHGDGNATRDYVHVDDVARAIVLAATAECPASPVYNIGSGVARSVRDVIAIVEEVTGQRLAISWQPPRVSDVVHNVLDISRARNELDWEPARSLHSHVQQVFDAR